MIKNKKILSKLEHSQYEHPFDKKALSALESTPGLGVVGNFFSPPDLDRRVDSPALSGRGSRPSGRTSG